MSFCSCCDQLVVLGLQPFELGGDAGPAAERLAGEVLAVLGERLAGLVLQLGGGRLELLSLELDPLAGGGDVGDAALHLRELLDLLLVREVESVAGVLDPVQGLVGLGLDDARQPLHHTHALVLSPPAYCNSSVGPPGTKGARLHLVAAPAATSAAHVSPAVASRGWTSGSAF